jgi:hypothetical protein
VDDSTEWQVLVALAVGIVIGVTHAHSAHPAPGHRSWHEDPSLPTEIVSLALLLLGAAVEAVALVRLFRDGTVRDNWRSPMLAVSWQERRRVLRQVRGRGPARPEDLPLARSAARRVTNQARSWLLYVGLGLVLAGQMIAYRGWMRILELCIVGLFLLGAGFMTRDVRAARRFLAEHPTE